MARFVNPLEELIIPPPPGGWSPIQRGIVPPPSAPSRPPKPVAQRPPAATLVGFDGFAPHVEPEQQPLRLAPVVPAVATPLAAPLAIIGSVALARVAWLAMGRFVSLGAIRAFVARWGPAAFRTVVGVALFSQIMELFDGGTADDFVFDVGKGRRGGKRYSIGANPRLNTLLKVAKRVDNIFIKYDTRMKKFRSRIKGPHHHRPRPQHHVVHRGHH